MPKIKGQRKIGDENKGDKEGARMKAWARKGGEKDESERGREQT